MTVYLSHLDNISKVLGHLLMEGFWRFTRTMEDKVGEVARRMSAERGGEGAFMNPTFNGRSRTQGLTCGNVSEYM